MAAERKRAGASPTSTDWDGIDWPHCHSVVKKLQVRIAKAVRQGRFGKAKSLQYLLTHSYSAKVLAIRKVTQNKGRATPGVDGMVAVTSTEKAALIPSLRRRGYRPKPLRRIHIKKKDGRPRPLSIPTVADRCMQQLHYQALLPVSESTADGTSYGFRPERSCADAIEDIFGVLGRHYSPRWVLEGDIKGCFDHISHEWLQRNVCMDMAVLAKWLKAGYIETGKLFPTEAGTPQGGIASPCLANMALDGVETMLDSVFGRRRPGIHYVRYADDFIVTAPSPEKLEEIREAMTAFLGERGLELSQDKTKVTHITQGFDFLGQHIRKYPAGKGREKLIIKPSPSSVKAFTRKIRDTIKKASSWPQANLINLLNPMIRGWVHYHRSVVSKVTFHRIDRILWESLWKWAKRRHPKKGKRWILGRYFARKGLRSYCFSALEKLANGTTVERNLFIASRTPIIRHTKIRRDADIHARSDDAYFEKRKTWKMNRSKAGRDKIEALLKRQRNTCPHCSEAMECRKGLVVHLKTGRLKGGGYDMGNLCIMHERCHDKITRADSAHRTAGLSPQ